MKDQKLKAVLNTPNLGSYALPKAIKALLARADQMVAYMQRGGRQPPNHIRLTRKDWLAIDRAVREQSDKKFNASTVNYNGRQIIAQDDAPARLELESAA